MEQRITALEGLGAEFAVASGRPLYTLHDNFGALLDELMVVADNGGLVVDHGKVIFKADMPVEDYRRMARITSEMGDYGFICGLDGCYVDAKAKHYEDFIRTFYTKCEFVDDLTQVDVPANKFTVMFPNNDALDQIGAYRDRIGGNFQYCCGRRHVGRHRARGREQGVPPFGVSRTSRASTRLTWPLRRAPNDADMLETVGFGYMMANAVPEMRAHADYVAPSNEERGVLAVIDQIVAARRAMLHA